MKRYLTLAMLVIAVLSTTHSAPAQSCPSWGPYAGAKGWGPYTGNNIMGGNAELMMADVMIPAEGNMPYTYTCAIQFELGKSGGYCGLQDGDGSDSVQPFNNIFSVWDYPNKVQLEHTYKDPMTFVGGFGGEGTGLHSHCDFGWKVGQWYTNVVRRWYAGGDRTSVAYFIFDQTKGEWRHYVTFSVPEANAMLHGDISSFLENFGDEAKRTRVSHYRSYWKLAPDGQWVRPTIIDAGAGEGNWRAESFGDDGLTLISCGKEKINGEKKTFPVTSKAVQPAILSTGLIYDLGAYFNKAEKKLVVDWSVSNTRAPQLSYAIEVYERQDLQGKPLAMVSGYGPEIREASLNLTGMAADKKNYYVQLKVKDIFNQAVTPKTIVVEELKP